MSEIYLGVSALLTLHLVSCGNKEEEKAISRANYQIYVKNSALFVEKDLK
jgi:hypothetical protein